LTLLWFYDMTAKISSFLKVAVVVLQKLFVYKEGRKCVGSPSAQPNKNQLPAGSLIKTKREIVMTSGRTKDLSLF
jgi:hypothetical protein